MSVSGIALEMRKTAAALRQNRGTWLSTVAAAKIDGWAERILALHPPASDVAAVNLLLEWAEIEDRFVEEADEPADKGRSAVIAAEFRRAAKAISALSVEHPPVSDDAVPAGFVLVPVEPTQSMISAACDMLEGRGNVINIWSAMLAVANEARNDGTR
jgi:hypothetical protein